MKNAARITVALATACLVFAPKSFAIFGVGDITFDPSNYAILIETKLETAARWSEEVLKYEKMIQQQIEQIEKAKKLLDGQNALRTTIGDWAKVVNDAKSLKLRAENLTKDWSREPRVALEVDYGQRGIVNRNAFGKQVPVNADRILKETNFEKVAKKTVETLENTAKEMGEINTEIAETYERMMRPGIDQQEYEKLRAKIESLQVRLVNLQAQNRDVLAYLQAQKTINDTQAAKENEVKTQVQESNDKEVSNQRNQLNVQEIIW